MEIQSNLIVSFTDLKGFENVEVYDLLRIRKDKEITYAIYAGNGYIVLLKQLTPLHQTDGNRRAFINVDVKKDDDGSICVVPIEEVVGNEEFEIHSFSDIEKPEWSNAENVLVAMKKHDLIEIKRSGGIRHWAIAVEEGNIVDLTPRSTASVTGWTSFTANTCFSTHSDDEDDPSHTSAQSKKYKRGIVQKRQLAEVVKNCKVRINNMEKYREIIGKSLPSEEIDANIEKALLKVDHDYD